MGRAGLKSSCRIFGRMGRMRRRLIRVSSSFLLSLNLGKGLRGGLRRSSFMCGFAPCVALFSCLSVSSVWVWICGFACACRFWLAFMRSFDAMEFYRFVVYLPTHPWNDLFSRCSVPLPLLLFGLWTVWDLFTLCLNILFSSLPFLPYTSHPSFFSPTPPVPPIVPF